MCEYSRSRSFHDDLILQDQASGERSQDHWSSGLFVVFFFFFFFFFLFFFKKSSSHLLVLMINTSNAKLGGHEMIINHINDCCQSMIGILHSCTVTSEHLMLLMSLRV